MRRTLNIIAMLVTAVAVSGEAVAAQYFVSSNGNDGATGTSAQTAFRTPERALRAMQNGDSVFFRAGDYWRLSEPFYITVSGTEQTPVVIGAYAVASSGQLQLSGAEPRPILDGGTSTPALGQYVGLVDVRGRHVHIRDLELRNSGGHGVNFEDTSFGAVDNVKVDWVYHTGILSTRSTDLTFASCEVSGDSHGWRDFGSEFWAGGIAAFSSARVEVHDCIVREGFGEGISTFLGSHDILFSGNTVFAARAVGIYVNSAYNVEIRNNLVLGTSNSNYHRGQGWAGPGIVLSNEQYQYRGFGGSLPLDVYTRNVTISNNLVAATSTGIAFWTEIDVPMESIEVSHNTFVENAYQIDTTDIAYRNTSINNNIFLSLALNTRDAQDIVSSTDISWRSNYWSEGSPVAAARGAGDVHGGLTLRKMDGWQNIRHYTDVTWADFEPSPGSPTIGAGTASTTATTDYNGQTFGTPGDLGALADRGGGNRPHRPIIVSLLQ